MPASRTALLTLLSVIPVPNAAAQTIYWTDIGSSKIQRLDLDAGAGVEDILTMGEVFTPVDIALDAAGGKLYWTEGTLADFMIQRANLDGTNIELQSRIWSTQAVSRST